MDNTTGASTAPTIQVPKPAATIEDRIATLETDGADVFTRLEKLEADAKAKLEEWEAYKAKFETVGIRIG